MTALLVMALFAGATWLVLAPRKRAPLVLIGAVLGLLAIGTGPALGVFLLLALPLAWPGFAVAAAVLGWSAGAAGGGRGTWIRAGLAAASAGAAVYGYGLSRSSFFALQLTEHCLAAGVRPDELSGVKSSLRYLPLHDTSCGSETVPGWINPALGVCALLLAACVAGAVGARRRERCAAQR